MNRSDCAKLLGKISGEAKVGQALNLSLFVDSLFTVLYSMDGRYFMESGSTCSSFH